MNKLVIERETLRPLAPPTELDDEQLEKCAGGTESGEPDQPLRPRP